MGILATPWIMADQLNNHLKEAHSVKSVRIWSYSGLHFPIFGLNIERYRIFLRVQSECGKMRSRITTNTATFHKVAATRFSDFL